MASEDLGKLSPEQLGQFNRAMADIKGLPGQQEEILERVMAGEIDIGNARIAALERYFDVYSKKLDLIARKYSSLDDSFLLLGRSLNEEYRSLASDLDELTGRTSFATAGGGATPDKSKSVFSTQDQERRKKLERETLLSIEDLRKAHEERLTQLRTKYAENEIQLEFARSKKKQDIIARTSEFRLTELDTVIQAETRAQTLSNALDIQIAAMGGKSGGTGPEESPESRRVRLLAAVEEEKSLQELQKQLDARRIQLEYEARAKNSGKLTKKDAEAINAQLREEFTERKKKLDELTRERFERERLLADPQVTEAFEKKKAERKRELELAAMRASNGVLTKEALASITAQVEEEFQLRSDKGKQLLSELGTARLAEAELALLRENDPRLVEAFEKKKAERKRELELAAMRENNGILTEEAIKAVNKQVEAEFQLTSDKSKQLLNELGQRRFAEAALESVNSRLTELKEEDPSVGAEAERQVAERTAQLIYEKRSEVNRALTREELAAIEAKAKAETLTAENLKKLADNERKKERVELLKKTGHVKQIEELEAKKAKRIAALELKYRKKNNGQLTAEQEEELKALKEAELDLSEKQQEKLGKKREKELKDDLKKSRLASRQELAGIVTAPLSKEHTLLDRFSELSEHSLSKIDDSEKEASTGAKIVAGLDTALSAISDLAAQLDKTIDEIAAYQGNIDTRLQGSKNDTNYAGSYWGQLTKDMMSVGAVTPFFKQKDFANNIKTLVDKGIAFDLKQRAFLMTIQEKIANTFNVADGTLLRLIRIQQKDSTAGRLGMESALNSFLNNMYETTEYLSDVASSVRGSLEEMEALMEGGAAAEVEYQVQKWMGSLYSVGMSQNAVTSISNALGQIAAGQVEALTNGGAGNLLVMAANEAGIPISEILSKGLTAEKTNQLLQATVNYLAEIAESSKDNQVVQQQLADVFGVKASDLRAATNLATDNKIIFGEYKTYNNMLKQLNDMAGSMYKRTSIGEMMTNVWENGQYTLAGSMANNPIAYLTYKMASLLESTAGGIALPALSVMGNMVDLETTVADLMRVASVSTGVLGSIGPIISGLASSFNGRAMLTTMGISTGSGLKVTPRGGGTNTGVGSDGVMSVGMIGEGLASGGAQTTSSSGYIGNASGSDVKNATMQEAENTKKQLIIEAKEKEEAAPVNVINMNVLKIYELLDNVANGRSSFSVKIDRYGLTKLNTTNSLTSAQGGVNGLLSNNGTNNSALSGGFGIGTTGGSSSSGSGTTTGAGVGSGTSSGSGASSGLSGGSAGGAADFGVGPSVNLGGWHVT